MPDTELPFKAMAEQKLHHAPEGGFRNPWRPDGEGNFGRFLRWKLQSNPWAKEKKKLPVFSVEKPDFTVPAGGIRVVWLGHSTVLIRTAQTTIITDPIFGEVWPGLDRATPFPLDPNDLPHIDAVLISHSHYDHLDDDSLRFLVERDHPTVISGPGYEGWYLSHKISGTKSLDWEQATTLPGGVRVVAYPLQHWSRRTLSDTNAMLWNGYLIEAEGVRLFWAGDTAYFPGFAEFGKRFGPIDLALLPVGAFEPRWFMQGHHMSPDDATQAAGDLRARLWIPIHWGTFDLSDEPLDLPIRHLQTRGSTTPMLVLNHGGGTDLDAEAAPP